MAEQKKSIRERRAGTGLSINVTDDGKHLHHFKAASHASAGNDVRYLITDGPAEIGDRWFCRSVRGLVDDDGTWWLAGFDGLDPGAAFGDHRVPVCWRQRKGESWEDYA